MSESGQSQPSYGNSYSRKKKRFRDREFVRESDYRGREGRAESGRPSSAKNPGEDPEKSQVSLSQPSAKTPVILAKPASGKLPGTSNESGNSWKEVAESPTVAIAPKLSMTFNRSPQLSGDKKGPILRSSSDSKFRAGASPNIVKQSLAQATSSSGANQTQGGMSTKTKDSSSSRCVKMLDSTLHWVEGGIEFLQDQNDFLVVGVIGMQGVGKSTVLSLAAGNRLTEPQKSFLFRPQTAEAKEKASHMTSGIDMAVTNDRLILLDTQPILSSSVLEQSIHYDRKGSSDYSSASSIEIQSLQITAFLLTVCHVVIVVQDWFTDSNIYNFLQKAEMLKPVSAPPSHDSSSSSEHSSSDLKPVILFVHNKMDSDMFGVRPITMMNEVMDNLVRYSNSHCKGYFSQIETNLYPGLSSILPVANEVNAFVLPNINDAENEEEKCDVTKVAFDAADKQFLSIPQYVGRPSTALLENTFRKLILSVPRHPLTHLPLSEKNWFHYAARTWEALRKSQLVTEYNRLLSS
ncbi:nonsense-mediated mRNA decay factor SMG9-like [Clavelina lepadiformis]|uniref:nonsense-mediated mRNA decay factor SMG9-like n=1 Tax=Clavelina lepadiformis TaxID=159417 RepID=UPI004041706D